MRKEQGFPNKSDASEPAGAAPEPMNAQAAATQASETETAVVINPITEPSNDPAAAPPVEPVGEQNAPELIVAADAPQTWIVSQESDTFTLDTSGASAFELATAEIFPTSDRPPAFTPSEQDEFLRALAQWFGYYTGVPFGGSFGTSQNPASFSTAPETTESEPNVLVQPMTNIESK
jgi:hypothetical protein